MIYIYFFFAPKFNLLFCFVVDFFERETNFFCCFVFCSTNNFVKTQKKLAILSFYKKKTFVIFFSFFSDFINKKKNIYNIINATF